MVVLDVLGTLGNNRGRPELAARMNRGSGKWKRCKRVLYRETLDDVVILVPGPESEPFALAGGAQLWRLLEHPHTTGQLLTALAEGSAAPRAQEEMDELLSQLADVGAVDWLPA
jgi:Coenzyme PQQ synthesis protein D (PqqD)